MSMNLGVTETHWEVTWQLHGHQTGKAIDIKTERDALAIIEDLDCCGSAQAGYLTNINLYRITRTLEGTARSRELRETV